MAIFPDGRMVSGFGVAADAAGARDRIADLHFITDLFADWNRDDPLLAGQMDMDRMAVLGFSWGTATAAEFCRADPRCRAAVLFDNWDSETGLEEVLRRGLYKPLLTVNNSTHADSGLFDKALRDAIWFQLSSTDHANFHDFYWVNFPSNVAGGREAAHTMNTWALWFLNKHLKGSTDPMPALADYPRIINFKQK
jgi:dienelactone hydrolase